jgi:phosphatidylserine/phosphatidylglycerophosphate/cardiolipin synthase-like enzyme
MTDFENGDHKNGFSLKLWRGERMCLLGFDVDDPEPDLVGFAIECRGPNDPDFVPLMNRIAFSYDRPVNKAVTGKRLFPSTEAPFQKFRWIHFPNDPRDGAYTYRATKMHMKSDETLKKGTSIALDISLDPVTYAGFLDVGFTRNFASSQAFLDKFRGDVGMDALGSKIIPGNADDGLGFKKLTTPAGLYEWMGFEAYRLLFDFLDEAVRDTSIQLDVFTYDFNEPDILRRLEQLQSRLRIIIDDSTTKKKDGTLDGHGVPASAESKAAKRLRASAGSGNVKRTHFQRLQHNKVFIASRKGVPFKVLAGSTNHSFRGLYIQANNVLVFEDHDIADLFSRYFEASFTAPDGFKANELSRKWHLIQGKDHPLVHLCFSPHKVPELSLKAIEGAMQQASSSVLYNVAFLNQIKSGPTRKAFDDIMKRPIFSYGVSDKAGSMRIHKPDGSTALVDFAFLAQNAPEPFRQEWSGQRGINVHHKFVVTDFSLPTAKVFTGSCNFAPGGEAGNGDHLILIEDRKVATGYAIEAIRVFDHLHFRSALKKAKSKPKTLKLKQPTAISGEDTWFANYYVKDSQKEKDRVLFAH